MAEKSLVDEAAEIAGIATNAEDMEDLVEACRIAVEAIGQGDVGWLGGVDVRQAVERLAADIPVLTLAAKLFRCTKAGERLRG